MEMRKLMIVLLVIVSLSVVLSVCSCGSDTTATTQAQSATTQAAQERKIIVGTIGLIPNVTFTDKDGKLTGYDVEVIRAMTNYIPGLQVDFQILDFPNLLLSLDSKKIDMAACLLEKNPDRAAKYLFPSESYLVMKDKLVVSDSNTTINSMEDMAGKTLLLSTGTNEQTVAEAWNAAHGNKIKLTYTSAPASEVVAQIKAGRADGAIYTDFDVRNYNAQADAHWKTVGEPLAVAHCYQVLRQGDTELAALVEKALKAMKEDGTLAKLSIQWLGDDFTKE
jgi:L-cystine transport system substrate-binding protein